MTTYYSADYLAPISSEPILCGTVGVSKDGTITGVYSPGDSELINKDIVKLKGILAPGFINGHCHLELSHMHGRIDRNIGLTGFLSAVMDQRTENREEILTAILEADKNMYESGIQAVGDHVNTDNTVYPKLNSKIHYHTFIEIMGMADTVNPQQKLDDARELEYSFRESASSITLHAPYSCSKDLFKSFHDSIDEQNIISIHNQESKEENNLFRYKKGAFLDFFRRQGIQINTFKAYGRSSIQAYARFLPKKNKVLLIHNTHTSIRDLHYLNRMDKKCYFCLCAKSNLYIEGALPNFFNFIMSDEKVILGTDSLASNDKLDILEEMKIIKNAVPSITLDTLLKWATLNGAEALEFDHKLGSLEAGKQSGLILLENTEKFDLTKETTVRRIV